MSTLLLERVTEDRKRHSKVSNSVLVTTSKALVTTSVALVSTWWEMNSDIQQEREALRIQV